MAELPSGTVTFLFTDIEGSTALWEHDRLARAKAVAVHRPLRDMTRGGLATSASSVSRRPSSAPVCRPPMG